ncbi:hypothetical protein MTO96_004814 [Rhipicephalus appendiculatus]
MEATREWVGTVAGVVTLASFVGGLSLAWRVRRAATSTGIAFAPVAAAAVCCHSWLLYGRAAKEFTVVWVNACGLPLMLINAAVHRAYARDSGPGWLLLAALSALQLTAPMMSVVWTGPLPELAAWALAACGLWSAYGALGGDVPLCASNLLGALVAAAELTAAALNRRQHKQL